MEEFINLCFGETSEFVYVGDGDVGGGCLDIQLVVDAVVVSACLFVGIYIQVGREVVLSIA